MAKKSKLNLINDDLTWNADRRYKVNSVVQLNGEDYQNITGKNSNPELLIDWQKIYTDIAISDVIGLPTALDDLQLNKEDKANKNIANGYAGLDSSGKINPIQLPSLAITDTFVVASQAEQLALVAEVGDVAVRTDLNKSFILRVTGASTLANWQELLSPTSVDQTIIDGSTSAVSGNAVFDALASKAPISSVHNPVTLGTANGLSLSTQQLSLGLASSGVTGALSGTDWNTFNNKVNGTGTNNFLTKWSGTNTVNASGAWRETSNRLANAADNGSSDFQVTGQIDLKSKNTQGDGGQLGAELLTTGTGDASWTGTSFATGYTHSTGSVTTLTSTLAPVINNLYQVAYTVTGRTAGSFTIVFGGTTTSGITDSSAVGHKASTTGTLVITPTSDFNGTIVLSIKQITAGTASFVFRDNGGTIISELRILGFNNTASGVNVLRNNTTGSSNTANGTSSLRNNTTGGSNTASGVNVLQNNTTGGNNTASGVNALLNNTTGNNNTANGISAGRFIANGTTSLTVANNSTFLGANTKALADNSTNETVVGDNAIGDGNNTVSIGNTSVVSSRLRGRLLQGGVVDNLIDSGQFSGNVLATGFKTASGTASQFLKANGSVDSNTYLTSASLPTVDQTIIDGSTNAVSGNAVFDALATKAPISSVHNPVTLGTANGLSLATQQLSLGLASSGVTGALSGTDWNTFNGKFNTPTGLTANYLTKWNGSGFGNSQIFDNGGNVGIGTNTPSSKLEVAGSIRSVMVDAYPAIGATNYGSGGFPLVTLRNVINSVDKAWNIENGRIVNGDLGFYNEGGQRVTFKDNGRVLINKTDDDLTNQLQVAGTISASPATTANQVVVKSQLDAVAARPYKVYTAVLTQQNTNDPSAVVLENTLGGTVVWTRNSTGNYYGTLNNAFPIQSKIALFQGGSMWGTLPLEIIRVQHLNSNTIQIFTQQATDGALVDSSLSGTSIEIRVYL